MENMNAGFYEIRAKLATLHQEFLNGTNWWKEEMSNLKNQLAEKDKEIANLKKQLNEKSS